MAFILRPPSVTQPQRRTLALLGAHELSVYGQYEYKERCVEKSW